MSFTAFGTKVSIPNCKVCGKWLGKSNCKDEDINTSGGAFIIKTSCNNFYHGNCYKKNDKTKLLCESERINLHHSNWWIVESFWSKNFGVKIL